MNIERIVFGIACGGLAVAVLLFIAYLAGCAGADRRLTLKEWWGSVK